MALTTWKDDKFEYRRYDETTEGDNSEWLLYATGDRLWIGSSNLNAFSPNMTYARPLPPPPSTPPVPPPEPPRPCLEEFESQESMITSITNDWAGIPCIAQMVEGIESLIGGIQTKMRETYPDHKFDNF